MSFMGALERMAQAHSPAAPAVVGRWAAVRLHLDRATGETLNVGVLFQPDGGAPAQYKLLGNVSGLRCVYGPDGAASAAFAIDQAAALLSQGKPFPPGWAVSLGPELHASGASVTAVVAGLYQRVVPLARHEPDDDDRLDTDDHRLSTGRLRRRVREIIRQRFNTKETPDFWHDSPVRVATVDGHALSLDLQVWTEAGTAVGAFACITSAWYTSKFHRDSYLNNGYRSLHEARQVSGASTSAAGLYVLRPMNDSRFSEDQLRTIDNEIDTMHWLLGRVGVNVHTYDNEASLAEGVLSLA